jgi:plasmid maintenance system antidote protein VapI
MARIGRHQTMTGALQTAIARSRLSFKALERETGVKRQSIMKFVAGEQSLRLDLADKLAVYFAFEIATRKVN